MIPTSNPSASTRMTVSEMPSMAMDPFAATAPRNSLGQGDAHLPSNAFLAHPQHLSYAVHVTQHQMAAQAVAPAQRTLKIDDGSGARMAQSGASESLGHALYYETLGVLSYHRQARAADRDGVSDPRAFQHGLGAHAELAARRPALQTPDHSHFFDETGEHQYTSPV